MSNKRRRQFASDNYSGICPEALEAMLEANHDHASAYGNDHWTDRAADLMRDLFETDCEVFFVFNGTAANSLALASLCQSYHSVICHQAAHLETDECGGPEFFSNGTKVLLVGGDGGQVDPDQVVETVHKRADIHFPKPKVLSVTQANELGRVYSTEHLSRLHEVSERCDLRLHMDGARFSNAAAALGCAPKEITWQRGIDVLCFGGTKMGMAVGECVVFFNKDLAHEFDYRCKQSGQLASKMRFLAAPWVGMLENGAWLKHAEHANRMAKQLEAKLREFDQLEILYPVEVNSVFLRLPEQIANAMAERGWTIYTFIGGCARLMCSWDTTDEDIDELLADLRDVIG